MTDAAQPGAIGSLTHNVEAGAAWGQFSDGWIVPAASPSRPAESRADVDETVFSAFEASHSTGSLTVTIGAGEGYIDGWLARDVTTDVDLAASTADQTVYVGWDVSAVYSDTQHADRDEADTVIVGLASAFGSLDPKTPLWTFDTDGSGVTTATDERSLGRELDAINARYDTDADGAVDAVGAGVVGATEIALGDVYNWSGTHDFTSASVTVASPTSTTDPATKEYVDASINGLDWQDSVLSEQNDPPGSPTDGDRYLVGDAPTGDWSGHAAEIAEWDGSASAWTFVAVDEGAATWVEDVDVELVYNGSDWVQFGATQDHGALQGLGDDDHTQYLLVDGTRSMAAALDMGGYPIESVGDVDGVDVSAHASDADAHHAPYDDEQAQDAVAAMLVAGNNISKSYDDGANTLTLDVSQLSTEEVEDIVGSLITAGNAVSVSYDDAGDSLSIAVDPSGISLSDLGSADHSSLSNVSAGQHRSDSNIRSVINNDADHGSTASHNYYTDSDAQSAVTGNVEIEDLITASTQPGEAAVANGDGSLSMSYAEPPLLDSPGDLDSASLGETVAKLGSLFGQAGWASDVHYIDGPSHVQGPNAYRGCCTTFDGRVVFAPHNANNVGIFNPSSGEFTTYGAVGSTVDSEFHGAVLLPDGRVLFVPWDSGSITVWDLDPDSSPVTAGHGQGANAFKGATVGADGRVYMAPSSPNNVGIFDPSNDSFSTGDNLGTNEYDGATLLPDGRTFFSGGNFIAYGANSPSNSDFIDESHSGVAVLPDGRALLVPNSDSNQLSVFDPSDDTTTNIGSVSNGYRGASLLPDGRVVLSPDNSGTVGIFDPSDDSLSTGPSVPTGTSAFHDATTVPDGRVILSPREHDSIGIVGTGGGDIPRPYTHTTHPVLQSTV